MNKLRCEKHQDDTSDDWLDCEDCDLRLEAWSWADRMQ